MLRLSPTQITMYLKCPAQYYFRYKEGLKLPPRVFMAKGSAVHKGQEENYRQKIESRVDMNVDDVKDIVATEFDLLSQETAYEKDENPGKEKDQAVVMAEVYHRQIAPTVQPVAVEQQIVIATDMAEVLGYIDVISEAEEIRDTKTKSKLPDENELAKDLQLSCYALQYRTVMGSEEKGIKMDCIMKASKPYVTTLKTSRTEADLKRFIKITDATARAIEAESFYPNHHEGWVCSPAYCGYWDICHKTF